MNFHRQCATDEAIRRAREPRRPGWPLSVGPNAIVDDVISTKVWREPVAKYHRQWMGDALTRRSGALRAEPNLRLSQAKPPVAIARGEVK